MDWKNKTKQNKNSSFIWNYFFSSLSLSSLLSAANARQQEEALTGILAGLPHCLALWFEPALRLVTWGPWGCITSAAQLLTQSLLKCMWEHRAVESGSKPMKINTSTVQEGSTASNIKEKAKLLWTWIFPCLLKHSRLQLELWDICFGCTQSCLNSFNSTP